MPLTEIDPNVSGRTSRTSNASASVKNIPKALPAAAGNDLLAGMLRTTTETGDIGQFSAAPRLRKLPRQAAFRRPTPLPHSIAPSRTPSHYSRAGSIRSAKSGRSVQDASSMPGSWPYSHYQFANSQPDFHSARSETRSSVAKDSIKSLPLGVPDRLEAADRSFSLTATPRLTHGLRPHPSLTSLRSQDTVLRPRSPLMPQMHLRNPSYRPISPTLSDTASSLYAKRHAARPGHFPRAHHASPYTHRDLLEASHRRAIANNTPPILRTAPRIEGINWSIGNEGGQIRRATNENLPTFQTPYQIPVSPDQRSYGAPSKSATYFSHSRPPFNRSSSQDTPSFNPERRDNDATPYMGFVQRVKTVLEERISHEDMGPKPSTEYVGSNNSINAITKASTQEPTMPADHRGEAGCSPDAAAAQESEIPSTVHDGPPGDDIQEQSSIVKRLTRDMVKSAMDAGSDVAATSDEAEDRTLPEDELEALYESPKVQPLHKTSTSGSGGSISQSKMDDSKITDASLDQLGNTLPNESCKGSEEIPSHQIQILAPSASPKLRSEDRQSSHSIEGNAKPCFGDNETPEGSYSPTGSPRNSEDDVAGQQGDSGICTSSMPGDFLQSRPPSFTDEIEDEQSDVKPDNFGAPELAADAQNNNYEVLNFQDKQPTSIARIAPLSVDEKIIENISGNRVHGRQLGSSYASSNHTRLSTTGEGPMMRSFEFPTRGSSLKCSLAPDSSPSSAPAVGPANNDSRPSAVKNFQHPLPELAEDSQEDASTTNLRMLGAKRPGFPRILRDQRGKSQPAPRASAQPEPPQTYLTRTLAETRNIPSFNFSQQDLTTKLNDALGLRSSRSLEDLKTIKSDDISPPALSRPLSSNVVSERYKSFFTTSEASEDDYEGRADVELPVDVESVEQQPASFVDDALLREIEKLSIPSVKNLTLRLSELLPSIKNSRSDMNLSTVDHAVDETVQEIRALGSPARMASLELDDTEIRKAKEPSHELARKETVATDNSTSERRVPRDRVYLRLMKELPALPRSDGKHPSRASSVGSPQPRLTSKEEKRKATLYELEGSAVVQTSREEAHQASRHPGLAPNLKDARSTVSLKGTTGTPTTPRPWNKDENYPWSGGTPTVTVTEDPNVADGTGLGDAPRIKLKKPRSNGDFSINKTERIARSMSPGPSCSSSLIPQADVFANDDGQGLNKRGILGSIKRKIGLGQRQEKAGIPVDPMFLHPEDHSATRTVRPGDRYPTSSLTPPGALNIDESRSYFSDDSSESEHIHSLRKRLTRLKAKRSAPENLSPAESRSDAHHSSENNAPSAARTPADFEHANIFQQDHVPTGMSKAEFRAKRFIEKLRVIFLKGGEILRNFHKSKKHGGAWHQSSQI